MVISHWLFPLQIKTFVQPGSKLCEKAATYDKILPYKYLNVKESIL
jgi:hypothetical protein